MAQEGGGVKFMIIPTQHFLINFVKAMLLCTLHNFTYSICTLCLYSNVPFLTVGKLFTLRYYKYSICKFLKQNVPTPYVPCHNTVPVI